MDNGQAGEEMTAERLQGGGSTEVFPRTNPLFLFREGLMMKTSIVCLLAILSCLLCGSAWADSITATTSCRTEGWLVNADKNMHNSAKLSVRNLSSSSTGNKAWIKFNIGTLPVKRLDTATLTVFLELAKLGSQHFDVSFVNDNCLDNIGWSETNITWNNAPGNDTASREFLDATKTTLLTTVNFTDGTVGQGFVIDILPALKSDTDGIVQFVLHNSPNLLDFSTHDNAVAERRPIINYELIPLGAKYPIPANKARMETTQPNLAWTNPDPNDGASKITCTVYFGADPNRPQMDKVTLPAGASSVDLTAANFPRFVPLINNKSYYWVVDCFDPSKGAGKELIEGVTWSFYTDNNEPPTIDAGADQVAWLGKSGTAGQEVIQLKGTVSDDGLPVPPAKTTLLWTQVSNGAPVVAITPDNQAAATVTITARGTYEFTLTADDSAKQTADTVRIVVGTNACDASHLSTGAAYNAGDANRDCVVNLDDFATLIAANWLTCTDTLTNCGK
jgi:hypothetical protein